MEIEFLGISMSVTWFLILTLVCLYFVRDIWAHSYWWRKGVIHERTWPLIGNLPAFAAGIPAVFENMKKKFGKTYGMYNFRAPLLVAGDPDMLRNIMVKNFSQFHNRIYFPLNNKEVANSVASLEDERWREVRNLLTPTFSTSKMKQMSALVNKSADRMVENIEIMKEDQGIIECKEIFGAFVMDTIGSCAFGLDLDSQANPNDPFVEHAKRAFTFKVNNPFQLIAGFFPLIGQLLAYLEIGMFFPVDVMKFFRDVTIKAVKLRESYAAGTDNKWIDFLQLMVDAQKTTPCEVDETDVEDENDVHAGLDGHNDVQFHSNDLGKRVTLTDDELIGQAIIFFTAGYETTTTLLGFIFYLLSTNPKIQEKLIGEVDEMTPSRDSVGYTSIASMPYLDQVVCETLRLYPPATILNRVCNETFNYNGMTIEKGVQLFIPVYTIHHDPEYWPEPEKFNPDRFSKANKDTRHPFAWLPFGAGPHNCIGMRFALMETKMAVARVLQKYRFETCSQTEIPPKTGDSGFLSPPNGVTLRAVSRANVVN